MSELFQLSRLLHTKTAHHCIWEQLHKEVMVCVSASLKLPCSIVPFLTYKALGTRTMLNICTYPMTLGSLCVSLLKRESNITNDTATVFATFHWGLLRCAGISRTKTRGLSFLYFDDRVRYKVTCSSLLGTSASHIQENAEVSISECDRWKSHSIKLIYFTAQWNDLPAVRLSGRRTYQAQRLHGYAVTSHQSRLSGHENHHV